MLTIAYLTYSLGRKLHKNQLCILSHTMKEKILCDFFESTTEVIKGVYQNYV